MNKSKHVQILKAFAEGFLIAAIFAAVGFALVAMSTADVANTDKVYGINLNNANTVNFRGEYNESSVSKAMSKLQQQIQKRGSKDYPIYLVIDSRGGSISDGMDLIQYINSNKNIHTITLEAMSMGAVTAQLVNGQRYVTKNSTMMFHRAAIGGLGGQLNDGEVESRLKFLKAMITDITTQVAARLGISFEELQQKQKDEYWIYGTDIVAQGAADHVVTIKCSNKLIKTTTMSEVQMFIFSMQVKFSECPLFRSPIQ